MPRGDRTGPEGAGPMTGRGLGRCAGYDTPGYMNGGAGYGRGAGHGFGRGYGRGFGGGFGYGRGGRFAQGYYPENSDVREETFIENDIRVLKDQLDAMQKRLDDLRKKSDG